MDLVDVCAVMGDMTTVVDVPVLIDVTDVPDPVESLFGPLGIGAVVGIACQSCAEVEETGIGDGILSQVSHM